jgi:hypothetical protein
MYRRRLQPVYREDRASLLLGRGGSLFRLRGGSAMTITVTDEGPSFTDLVRNMRKAQKEFYQTRDRVVLEHAKQLEREVDAQLDVWQRERTWETARQRQPELFIGG